LSRQNVLSLRAADLPQGQQEAAHYLVSLGLPQANFTIRGMAYFLLPYFESVAAEGESNGPP